MGDAWIVRVDEPDGPVYLNYADDHMTVLVPYPEDAKTFSHRTALQAARDFTGAVPVRRFEELRK